MGGLGLVGALYFRVLSISRAGLMDVLGQQAPSYTKQVR